MKNAVLLLGVISLSACASNPNKIAAAYISPLQYQNYDCDQLGLEMAAVERKTNELYHSLRKRNKNDKWATGVGAVLFAPALFFMKGKNSAENAEYARMLGEYEALRVNSVQRKCGLNFAENLADRVTEEQPIAPTPAPTYQPSESVTTSKVNKVRANTPSGYCLDVPSDYVGTGSSSKPAVTSAMPRCSSLSADE